MKYLFKGQQVAQSIPICFVTPGILAEGATNTRLRELRRQMDLKEYIQPVRKAHKAEVKRLEKKRDEIVAGFKKVREQAQATLDGLVTAGIFKGQSDEGTAMTKWEDTKAEFENDESDQKFDKLLEAMEAAMQDSKETKLQFEADLGESRQQMILMATIDIDFQDLQRFSKEKLFLGLHWWGRNVDDLEFRDRVLESIRRMFTIAAFFGNSEKVNFTPEDEQRPVGAGTLIWATDQVELSPELQIQHEMKHQQCGFVKADVNEKYRDLFTDEDYYNINDWLDRSKKTAENAEPAFWLNQSSIKLKDDGLTTQIKIEQEFDKIVEKIAKHFAGKIKDTQKKLKQLEEASTTFLHVSTEASRLQSDAKIEIQQLDLAQKVKEHDETALQFGFTGTGAAGAENAGASSPRSRTADPSIS